MGRGHLSAGVNEEASTSSGAGAFTNDEVNALDAAVFDHDAVDDDWVTIAARHSADRVTAL